jgi:hypothetical protein
MTAGRQETGFDETGRKVCLTWPTVFAERESLSPSDARRADIRRFALAVLIGADTRPLAEIAAEIGCTRQALSLAVHAIGDATGLSVYFVGADTRRKFREAARKAWATKRRKAATGELV